MKYLLILVIATVWIAKLSKAQSDDSIVNRIVLVGDAGALTNGQHAVAQAIKKNVPLDARTTIVYLGDNIYKIGLPDDAYIGYQQALIVLSSKFCFVKNRAEKV